jgi:hypothetical protein
VRFLAETRQGGDVDARELREVDIDLPAWMRSKPGRGPGDSLLGVERPQWSAPVDLLGWYLVICSSPLSCARQQRSGPTRVGRGSRSRHRACSNAWRSSGRQRHPANELVYNPNVETQNDLPIVLSRGRGDRRRAALSALAGGTPEHDEAVAEGGCSHGMGD